MGWRDVFSANAPGTQLTQSTKTLDHQDSVDIVDSVRSVAQKIRDPESHPIALVDLGIVARRWPEFVARVVANGANREEVDVRFGDMDRANLCAPEHDEARLAACARSIADVILNARPMEVDHAGLVAREAVRCAECRNFVRRAVTPGYGACAAGVPSTGATVLHFAMHRHPCGKFANVL